MGKVKEIHSWEGNESDLQRRMLVKLLEKAASTEYGRKYGFGDIAASTDVEEVYRKEVPACDYEQIRSFVMQMVKGEPNVLWPGHCRNFAQSSGTTGGRSKYIPITDDGLRENHYKGASCSVAAYLASNPESKMFSGKGLILGGSFANSLDVEEHKPEIMVGDLSATLIQRINPFVNHFRVPDKSIALMEDWEEKLPLLAEKAAASNITNISGVPSWMLRVILKVLELKQTEKLKDVWPNLEVFFHGGISFAPYREEYNRLCEGLDMHWSEVYNASEGYFGFGDCTGQPGMLLLLNSGVYYEFMPLGSEEAIGVDQLKEGKVYEMVVSTCNGLWRYRIGDTVRIESIKPLRISVAGRTKSYINAFGEELMEENAECAIAAACKKCGCQIINYTASPVYAHGNERGRHQWIIEWRRKPESEEKFAEVLDEELRKLNSDYDAKRAHDIFLDLPEVVSARHGLFDKWLSRQGSGKLGGQRKIPRLNNSREIADRLIELNKAH